ncbi:Aste57867_8995 [Aphanomyces stellatus]|uniref:Aste57867_8995 protein n=1 Tax=Aphanomyces stellatus TaxID=120398 RepID=A0A485KLW5_9STRA|nr:hypothetical protein As57867_008960 [Aphanomyces stellatus]VFT85879.1 Aste57867_8995 [Aphanomyces stellatus]
MEIFDVSSEGLTAALSSTALVCTTVVLLLFVYVTYVLVIAPALSPLNAIPGPKPSSILFGSMRDVTRVKWAEGHFPEPALTWTLLYGGAVHYRFFLTQRVLLTDMDALKYVYTNADAFPRDKQARSILRNLVGGDGLLSTEGPTHATMRKLLMPHFGLDTVKSYVGIFTQHTTQLCALLGAAVDCGDPIDVDALFIKMTLDVIGVAAFGYRFQSLSNGNDRVLHAYRTTVTHPSMLVGMGKAFLPFFDHWPIPSLVQAKQAKQILYDAVDDVIAAKIKIRARRDDATDLLDLLLEHNDMAPVEARAHILTFMLAGHETTSSTLSWVFALLAQHPNVEARARAEARAASARLAASETTWAALSELKYVAAVVQETLRLYPTVPQLAPRICTQDCTIPMSSGAPIFLPKGTAIAVNTGAMHRNPVYWERPLEFLPERWIEGSELYDADKLLRGGKGHTYCYMPFSTGLQNCLGMRFALAELHMVVALILAQFSLHIAPEANLNPSFRMALKPVKLAMTVHRVP